MSLRTQKSPWQADTEKQLSDIAYELLALREENAELRRMIGNITLYLCGVRKDSASVPVFDITVKDVSHVENHYPMGGVA